MARRASSVNLDGLPLSLDGMGLGCRSYFDNYPKYPLIAAPQCIVRNTRQRESDSFRLSPLRFVFCIKK